MRYLIQFLINWNRNRKPHYNPRQEVMVLKDKYIATNKALLMLEALARKQEHRTQKTKRKLRA